MDNSVEMVGDDLELLITAVVAADDEQQARAACAGLVRRVGGRIGRAFDCSDEEPGCWSVTIGLLSGERATQNVAGALARAVRTFVRQLGDEFPTPRVACEPPTAWTVLEDPALLDGLLPGCERLLVEAWAGGDPRDKDLRYGVPRPEDPRQANPRDEEPRLGDPQREDPRREDRPHQDDPRDAGRQDAGRQDADRQGTRWQPPGRQDTRWQPPRWQPPGRQDTARQSTGSEHSGSRPVDRRDDVAGAGPGTGGAGHAASAPAADTRLALRVDVATDRSAGAEWQARAVASRVARSGKITRVAPHGHLLSVHIDLGSSVNSPAVALRDAVVSLGRSGWSAVEWSGAAAATRWSATPVPPAGIAALELTATPASAFVWTVPD